MSTPNTVSLNDQFYIYRIGYKRPLKCYLNEIVNGKVVVTAIRQASYLRWGWVARLMKISFDKIEAVVKRTSTKRHYYRW